MGHGNYATGIESTVRLIVGPTEGVNYIDFLEEDSSETLMTKIEKVVEENKGSNIVFICDILGGTPFNTAVSIAVDNKNMAVVAGCNANSIIETIMTKDLFELDELTDGLIEKTKSSVCKFEPNEIVMNDEMYEDGI